MKSEKPRNVTKIHEPTLILNCKKNAAYFIHTVAFDYTRFLITQVTLICIDKVYLNVIVVRRNDI